MPASIPISAQEKKWFLKLIHEVYDIHLVDSYACQRYSDELISRAKISISYNTLRRLFGVIRSTNQASRFTLDAVSQSIGYADFSSFQLAVNQLEVDFFNEILILYRLNNLCDDNLILRIVQDFQFQTWGEVYQLKSIVDLCLEVENFNLLTEIFKLKFALQDEDTIWKLYVAFQSIFIQCKHQNQAVIDFVSNLLPVNEMAQRILLQLYVDEEALEGYYGHWINQASLGFVDDMEMFKLLMQIQQAFNVGDKSQALVLINRCNELLASNHIYYHPILKGRIAAWNFMLLDDRNVFIHFFKSFESVHDQLYYVAFFYRLLDLFEYDITSFDVLEHFHIDESRITFMFVEKQNINILYILKAKYFLKKNNKIAMIQAIEKLNPLYKYSCLHNWVDKQWNYLNMQLS